MHHWSELWQTKGMCLENLCGHKRCFLAIVIVASSGTYMTHCRFKAWIDAFLSTVLVAVKSFSAPCLGNVSGVRWALEHFQTCTSPAAIRLTGYVSRKTSTAVLWNVINKNWFKLGNSIRKLIRSIIYLGATVLSPGLFYWLNLSYKNLTIQYECY